MQCCGSGRFISDPGYELFHPGSRVKKVPDPGSGFGSASKNFDIFNPKNCSYALGKMILDVHPGSGYFFPIPDPNPQH
jgi:hypothetical protein